MSSHHTELHQLYNMSRAQQIFEPFAHFFAVFSYYKHTCVLWKLLDIVSKPNKILSAQFLDHILIQYFPYYTGKGALNPKMCTFMKDMSFLLN